MIFNYLGLGVKLKYPLLLPGYTRRVCSGKDSDGMSRGAIVKSQMGALWRWARGGPMRLGWIKWTQAKGQPRPRQHRGLGNA